MADAESRKRGVRGVSGFLAEERTQVFVAFEGVFGTAAIGFWFSSFTGPSSLSFFEIGDGAAKFRPLLVLFPSEVAGIVKNASRVWLSKIEKPITAG